MTEGALKIDEAKTALNARAKASMRAYLKSRTWPERIESIERMNEAARLATRGDAEGATSEDRGTRPSVKGSLIEAFESSRSRT